MYVRKCIFQQTNWVKCIYKILIIVIKSIKIKFCFKIISNSRNVPLYSFAKSNSHKFYVCKYNSSILIVYSIK